MATTHAVRDDSLDADYEGSRGYVVHTPFDIEQLDREVTKAMNWKNNAGLIVAGDPATASKDSPVRVWVVRGEVDDKAFLDTVKAHKPTPAATTIETIKTKVKAGEVLSPAEVTTVLAHLLG